ncbi:TlpA family protein disulfide reductase [Nocardioides KLBMP 9356]|uniref:TlpA family protein disulfide reductase n=1 Tax=Nocardioides potassii TaxID=2911371 RepID=A0ABS9HDD0_9ACTN|nr:TlpA disulfide reductase family protein [Nocardioides potassii]MCF6378126.1 TlpA family protein disulfide reductase [Nocardioides potassii]
MILLHANGSFELPDSFTPTSTPLPPGSSRPLWVEAGTLEDGLGWVLKPQGVCIDDACVPLIPRDEFVDVDGRVNVTALAERTGRPLVVDQSTGIASLGEPAGEESTVTSVAPGQVVLDLVGGGQLDLSHLRGRKVLLAAWASWCLCRHDLAGWEEEYRALRPHGLEVVSVALDERAADTLPWLEEAEASHHACVDPRHRVAEVFGMVNVPMVVWIDEAGDVVRPADTQFATEHGAAVSGLDWRGARAALRRWVLDGDSGVTEDTHAPEASYEEQLARAHWRIAGVLLERDDREGAARHLEAAGEAAPHDFTIRRAGLKLRGEDPFGELYWDMRESLLASGGAVYRPLPDWQGRR